MTLIGENKNPVKCCFVIMGFGMKTDFATGRKLDLNKSYKLLIKPVVEKKGLKCVRADEILHSGSIDYQMYKELLNADLVIADLSTANVNAFYELGIRHALKRRSTIVISEDKYSYPFDLNHINITNYTHLGEALDYEEVERFRKVLGDIIDKVLDVDESDSPVYTYLHELTPPAVKTDSGQNAKIETDYPEEENFNKEKSGIPIDNPTLNFLIEEGETALTDRNYLNAKLLFEKAIKLMNEKSRAEWNNDPYLIQRLAFATYKAKQPDIISALKEAIQLLSKIDVEHTNDTETVSLAGRIEKKLFEKGDGEQHLSKAIQYYERGYFLLHNRYHGVNLAFLFNKRADTLINDTKEDKIADMIFANRVRRQVLIMCENDWNEIKNRKNRHSLMSDKEGANDFSDYTETDDNEQMFWIQVNKAECHFGLGEMQEYKKALEAAKEISHAKWMMKSFESQHIQLQILMRKYGHLLNPPWSED